MRTIAAWASLAGPLLIIALWIWTLRRSQSLWIESPYLSSGIEIESWWGALHVQRFSPRLKSSYRSWEITRSSTSEPWLLDRTIGPSVLGFTYRTTTITSLTAPTQYTDWSCVRVPLWSLLLLSLVPPVLAWRRARAIARAVRESKHCQSCGYDLRASRERCPECGRAIPPADKMPATS